MTARIPNLFVVGAPKSGTTALVKYLSRHPDVFVPSRKELHFLCQDLGYHYRVETLAEYCSYFEEWESEAWAVDGSVWYLYSEDAAANIQEYSPDARVIIMLRRHADFLESLHQEYVRAGYEQYQDFATAWQKRDARRDGRNMPLKSIVPSGLLYEDACFFAPQVERFIDTFGRERVLIINYDDFSESASSVFDSVCQFLDVKPGLVGEFERVNARDSLHSASLHRFLKKPPRLVSSIASVLPSGIRSWARAELDNANKTAKPKGISREVRAELEQRYSADARKLSELFGGRFNDWLDQSKI